MTNLSDEDKITLAKMKAEVQRETQKAEMFWQREYPNLNLEERKAFWLRRIWEDIRIQGGITDDEFTMFNKSNYDKWKKIDPAIDEILYFVINELNKIYSEEGKLSRELNHKLGRI